MTTTLGTNFFAEAGAELEYLKRALHTAPQSILLATPEGHVFWANRNARRSASGSLEDAAAGVHQIRRTLALAAAGSQPLVTSLEFAGRRGLWHVWRVAGSAGGGDPILILQEDARQRLLSKFLTLKRKAETAGGDRALAAETARRLRAEATHLQRLMRIDRLTGVMNAGGIEDFTGRALRQSGARGVFVFADLDGFKAVNDTYGHDAGDTVLKVIAQRFQGATRAGDCVARLGGDEFAFWFDGMTEPEIRPIVRRLEELASEPIEWQRTDTGQRIRLQVDASFGRAVAPSDGTTFAALKAVSDARMYARKRDKRRPVAH